MKKVTTFLVVLLVLASCSNWKYGGKAKVSNNEVHYVDVVIEKDKVAPLVFNTPNTASEDLVLLEKTVLITSGDESNLVVEPLKIKDLSHIIPPLEKVLDNEDSLRKQDAILREAISTEKQAKKTLALGITSTVFSVTPLVIVGLILSIIGLKKGISVLNSQYITPVGLKAGKAGMVLSIIGLVISSIVILAFLLLILLFISFL